MGKGTGPYRWNILDLRWDVILRKRIFQRPAAFVLLGVMAITLCASLLLQREEPAVASAAEITNWGLSFQKEGEAPVGNASAEYLKQFDSYYVGDANQKTIYLTFDCGFENGNTAAILDALKKHDAKACFFVVGNYLETGPGLVQRMVEEGHLVGNHTYHHPDMSKIGDMASFQQEIGAVEEKFRQITGQDMPKYYRPPQGKFNESNLKMAQELGYQTIFWSLAYVDWYTDKQPTHEEAYQKLLPRIHPGAIVLLHVTSQTNGEIMDELLTKWEEQGYTFGTLDQLTTQGN